MRYFLFVSLRTVDIRSLGPVVMDDTPAALAQLNAPTPDTDH